MRPGIKIGVKVVEGACIHTMYEACYNLLVNCDSLFFFFSLIIHMLVQPSVSLVEVWWTLMLQ